MKIHPSCIRKESSKTSKRNGQLSNMHKILIPNPESDFRVVQPNNSFKRHEHKESAKTQIKKTTEKHHISDRRKGYYYNYMQIENPVRELGISCKY